MFVETNLSFILAFIFIFIFTPSLIDSSIKDFLLQEMQPWSTTCSQVAPLDSLMVISNLLFFNFGGDLLVMEFNFWWSFPSGGVLLHTALALPSGRDFVSLTTAAVLTCPLWWSVVCGIVWFTQLDSCSVGKVPYLLAAGPGFDPR